MGKRTLFNYNIPTIIFGVIANAFDLAIVFEAISDEIKETRKELLEQI